MANPKQDRGGISGMCVRAAWVAPVLAFLLAAAVVPTPSQAQTFQVLHTFQGPPADGAMPLGRLILDPGGNLYGTTALGGKACKASGGCGTAFKMNNNGKLIWLSSLKGQNGSQPMAGLVGDAAGNLYGTTTLGGKVNNDCAGGCGVVFKLDRTGKETVLYHFRGEDGANPEALLVEDGSGNLYGTTYAGGTNYGVVFKVNQAGKEAVLHRFIGPPKGGGDGATPLSGVIADRNGNLYGTTDAGGHAGDGVVYKMDSTGKETLLYSFLGGADGAAPNSVLVADAAGNLYGTTQEGGNSECGGSGCGTVFELSPQLDGSWAESVLYVFCSLSNCADGERPLNGPLVRDAAGNLYGTTYFGGTYQNCNGNSCGVVFKLDSNGQETVLYNFTGGADGADPWAGLTMDAAGNLYGVASGGGNTKCFPPLGCGVVFKITP